MALKRYLEPCLSNVKIEQAKRGRLWNRNEEAKHKVRRCEKEVLMPAEFIASMSEARYITWRPKSTTAASDEGPADKRLVIHFTGRLSEVPWLIASGGGYDVDLNVLVETTPNKFFDKKWLRGQGKRHAKISGAGNNYIIEVKL